MTEKLFFYDCETTGLDSRTHGIHQISGCIRIDGVIKEYFDFKMRPPEGTIIDAKALAVSGLTPADIEEYPPFGEAYLRFIRMLAKYVDRYNPKDKFIMCGFNNNAFDNEFMRRWFEHSKDAFFGAWFWADTLDARVLAMQYLKAIRPRMENFKQMTVARQLGIEVDNSKLHEAQYDVQLLMKIYDAVVYVKDDIFA